MNYKKWLRRNTESLEDKIVAVTGTTGGLGRELCCFLAELGAELVLLDRNKQRSEAFAFQLRKMYGVKVTCIKIELEDIESVKSAVRELLKLPLDIFIHNAGAYKIPKRICSTGYGNVFQINFISPYYIIRSLMPLLKSRKGRVVAVSSIAHNYSLADFSDIDFSKSKKSSRVYGNAKRYLTFSLYGLFKDECDANLAVTHPGITLTGITAHYPRLIFALIKYPMKIIFMSPKKASLSILKGVFESTDENEWIGPAIFNIWGYPNKKSLNTYSSEEMVEICHIAEKIYLENSVIQ